MDQIKIGRFISQKRKEHGFLQKDIAERLGISEKTVSKWECGGGMPEVVFMEPLCTLLGITVNELLAGEDIPIFKLLDSIERSRLELVRQLEFEQLKMRLYKLYDIEIDDMQTSENGAGGLTYFVSVCGRKYVVKYPSENEMNHPETEAEICGKLNEMGIPACRFIPNRHGDVLSSDETGRRFTVQEFYEGETFAYNEAPAEYQKMSAQMLAGIHAAMKELDPLPTGIGADFFRYRKPQNMHGIYEKTLNRAEENGDRHIAEKIRSNIRITDNMPRYEFDADRFTCGNTHGDYNISQLIWNDGRITGVIDWTCACTHPYIWEIVRSYVFMAPEAKSGIIDIDALISYISAYLEIGRLRSYDIENAGKLFYYFLAVCDFYGQYYGSLSKNRYIYLKQAEMASGLLVWFDSHIDELNDRLAELGRKIGYREKLAPYYDDNGRLVQYPSKKPLREQALAKIAECLEYGRTYAEKEINDIIIKNIAFDDHALIRREMYQMRLIDRKADGSEYWRERRTVQ